MSCCETQNLAVGYGAPLLRDIALHAERGKILALIGPNGAGKSTLLKTLAGQLAAQGGAVLLDGQDLTAYTPNARARKLALMLPHTARTELTSCFEVAAAGRYPYTGRLGILSDADRQQVHDALCLVRAEELEDRDFARISDGQRQRVLLARAVCQQPEILLLDEPTSFLDVKGKAELMDILQVLAHEKNVAVIVTLHELELAQRLADAVVCVAPSGVSAVLAPQDAFAQDNICALFGLSTDQYAVLFAGSGAAGSKRLYDYLNNNPSCMSAPVDYTNAAAVIGALDNFVSINNAVDFDLYGQINAESAGIRHISGSGGQQDFVLGAYLSKGGKSFVCASSTFKTKDGQVHSRIRPTLQTGSTVTDTKTNAHYLVTEYGKANLKGMSSWQRAEAIIGLAHPDFRDELIKEAEKMRIWRKSNKIS